ncbi:unnamed protein product [Hermetia illucens]|uniref:SYO1-like TPR repeats domain-containing protein n=1 Tax=Hermetia illucens TaxID=343691 RepID=A0A7R8YV29_HERIL|nr:HEAT repeat-containing protein 3 [Hermetia illucens]CAD7086432.1 unnamed protein product [Hermetia illucens]
MGKTRKNKRLIPRVNPLGIPSNREVDENEELFGINDHPEGPIQAIFEQLQSVSVEEKMNALQSLALMSASVDKARVLSSSEIIRVAAPLLMDRSQPLRNATAGALRNLSVCGVDVCENLVEQDVLTPLLALLNEYAMNPTWVPIFDQELNNQLDEKSDTFLQAINLLWNLCESTSVALENFNQTSVVQSFIRCLDFNVFGLDISIAVAQCLLVISEDNANCWNILNNFVQEFLCLLNIDGDPSHALLRTLAAGILSNVPALAAAHSAKILEALAKTLDLNHREVLGSITSKLPLLEEQDTLIDVSDNPNAMEEETDEAASRRRRLQELPTEVELEVKSIERLLEAQRVAAETITNICSSDDDEWADDDNDENSDAESVHDYENSNNSSTNLQNIDRLPVDILEAIKSLGLIEKLWQRAQPIPENVYLILQESKTKLSKKVRSLRLSALLCLQNLCNTMTTEDLGGPDAIYGVWLDLGQQVFQGPNDIVILEPATSLMRASLEHLKHSPELFKQMTLSDLELILNGLQNCSEAEIRANWLRMLGILGCLLSEPLVKVIISFILETCLKEDEVWTISEAIDALMDMFSDNDWEQISFELNLQQKCVELEKIFKTKIRQQKRDLKDRYPAVMTVRTNFTRFVKYIEGQMKNYKPQRVS